MKDFIKSFVELDYTKYPYILIFTIIFVLSRIPFLNLGFGNDPDAWRIANTALDLNQLFIYNTSRFPGYPLPEYVYSIFINFGWVATNILTLIITLISILVFAKILNELKVKNKGLIIVTFAFLPIIWINSTITMDYMWALAFILISWYFLLKNQHIAAGLAIGLAISSRPTSAILLVPFIYYLISKNESIKAIQFLIVSLVVSFVFFLPLILQYGLSFIIYYKTVTDLYSVTNTFISYFGFLAIIVLILIITQSSKTTYQKIKSDNNLIFASLVIFLELCLFLINPYETAYLIPAIPFGLYLLSKISNEKLLNILCIFLILNSFISINLITDTSGVIEKGIVFSNANDREILVNEFEKIDLNSLNNSIVITGESYPILGYYTRKSSNVSTINNSKIYPKPKYLAYLDEKRNINYVYIAKSDEIKTWENKGFKIYYAGPAALATTKVNFNFDLSTLNATNIL